MIPPETIAEAKAAGKAGRLSNVTFHKNVPTSIVEVEALVNDLRELFQKHGLEAMHLGSVHVDKDGFVTMDGVDLFAPR